MCRTDVGLSVASAAGAWMARVWVSARVVRCTLTDAREGGDSGRGGRGGNCTVVVRPRLLVTVPLGCVEDFILCGGLT